MKVITEESLFSLSSFFRWFVDSTFDKISDEIAESSFEKVLILEFLNP